MYHNGEGGDKDIEKAIFYYKKASDQGYNLALRELSIIYSRGIGVKKDLDKANELDQRALANFGKSLSYYSQFKQIIKYQLGEF